jgi:hypothetical protein
MPCKKKRVNQYVKELLPAFGRAPEIPLMLVPAAMD